MTVVAGPAPELLLLGFLCPLCAQPLNQETGELPCGHQLPETDWVNATIHRIPLPYPQYPLYPALSMNGRGNRWATNADVQQVRSDVAYLLRHDGARPGRHVAVHLSWSPRRRSGQDQDNLGLLYKACCDAVARGPRRPTAKNPGAAIGLDLVPDDTPQHMTKIMPVILPKGDQPGMWLTVIIHR